MIKEIFDGQYPLIKKVFLEERNVEVDSWYGGDYIEIVKEGWGCIPFNREEFNTLVTLIKEMEKELEVDY